jgi:hypothetical protein
MTTFLLSDAIPEDAYTKPPRWKGIKNLSNTQGFKPIAIWQRMQHPPLCKTDLKGRFVMRKHKYAPLHQKILS